MKKVLACLPALREFFYSTGIDLPRQYVDEIEEVRVRHPDERDYQFYSDEVAYEEAALPYPWQPSIRHLLNPDERSPYLEHQAQFFEPDAFSLDRNFNLFVGRGQHRSLSFREAVRNQKLLEAERYSSMLNEVCGGSSKASVKDVTKIAESFGFVRQQQDRSTDGIKFSGNIGSHPELAIKLVDLNAFRKQGSVMVQYSHSEILGRPFGIHVLWPGATSYYHHNESADMIRLSFYLQVKFFVEIARALT